jgi:hypothetical protein
MSLDFNEKKINEKITREIKAILEK